MKINVHTISTNNTRAMVDYNIVKLRHDLKLTDEMFTVASINSDAGFNVRKFILGLVDDVGFEEKTHWLFLNISETVNRRLEIVQQITRLQNQATLYPNSDNCLEIIVIGFGPSKPLTLAEFKDMDSSMDFTLHHHQSWTSLDFRSHMNAIPKAGYGEGSRSRQYYTNPKDKIKHFTKHVCLHYQDNTGVSTEDEVTANQVYELLNNTNIKHRYKLVAGKDWAQQFHIVDELSSIINSDISEAWLVIDLNETPWNERMLALYELLVTFCGTEVYPITQAPVAREKIHIIVAGAIQAVTAEFVTERLQNVMSTNEAYSSTAHLGERINHYSGVVKTIGRSAEDQPFETWGQVAFTPTYNVSTGTVEHDYPYPNTTQRDISPMNSLFSNIYCQSIPFEWSLNLRNPHSLNSYCSEALGQQTVLLSVTSPSVVAAPSMVAVASAIALSPTQYRETTDAVWFILDLISLPAHIVSAEILKFVDNVTNILLTNNVTNFRKANLIIRGNCDAMGLQRFPNDNIHCYDTPLELASMLEKYNPKRQTIKEKIMTNEVPETKDVFAAVLPTAELPLKLISEGRFSLIAQPCAISLAIGTRNLENISSTVTQIEDIFITTINGGSYVSRFSERANAIVFPMTTTKQLPNIQNGMLVTVNSKCYVLQVIESNTRGVTQQSFGQTVPPAGWLLMIEFDTEYLEQEPKYNMDTVVLGVSEH